MLYKEILEKSLWKHNSKFIAAYFRMRLIIEFSIRIFSRSTLKIKVRL